MSGVDEQIRDFPKCINCNRHGYWIGRREHSDIRRDDIFFNPPSFRGRNGRPVPVYDNDVARIARVEELEEVIEIKCDACRGLANAEITDKIICAARYLIREWGSKDVGY